MIARILQERMQDSPSIPCVIDDLRRVDHGAMVTRMQEIARALKAKGEKRINLYGADSVDLLAALVATDCLGVEACVLDRQMSHEEVEAVIGALGAGLLLADAPIKGMSSLDLHALSASGSNEAMSSAGEGKVIVLTTGTTGRSKATLYSWQRLTQQVEREGKQARSTWLLTYPMNHFAGIAMWVHLLVNGQTLVIPRSLEAKHLCEVIRDAGVDAISATPTFWRVFAGKITQQEARELALKRITLGGEPSTAEILARLRVLFPEASIKHVYATTELGSCFSVGDGQAGFPRSYLERPVGNVELKIVDGELYIKAQNRMLGYIDGTPAPEGRDGWIASGDLVQVENERVLFRGRKSEVINVGGIKVYPPKVEEVILEVKGVQAVRVSGRKNPVTGELVSASVQLEDGAEKKCVLRSIREQCRVALSRYEHPREIEVVNALPVQNQKILRRAKDG